MQIRTKATQCSQSSLWLCSGLELIALPSPEVLHCTGPFGRFLARPSQFIGSGAILCALLHYSPNSGHSFPLTSPWPLPLRASVVLYVLGREQLITDASCYFEHVGQKFPATQGAYQRCLPPCSLNWEQRQVPILIVLRR